MLVGKKEIVIAVNDKYASKEFNQQNILLTGKWIPLGSSKYVRCKTVCDEKGYQTKAYGNRTDIKKNARKKQCDYASDNGKRSILASNSPKTAKNEILRVLLRKMRFYLDWIYKILSVPKVSLDIATLAS